MSDLPFIPAETAQWRAMFEAAHYLTKSTLMKHRVGYDRVIQGWRITVQEASLQVGYDRHSEVAQRIAADAYQESAEGIAAHQEWLASQDLERHTLGQTERSKWIIGYMDFMSSYGRDPGEIIDYSALRTEAERLADGIGLK